MNYSRTVASSALAACMVFLSFTALAQDTSNLPHMNPKLSPEERAADLVGRQAGSWPATLRTRSLWN